MRARILLIVTLLWALPLFLFGCGEYEFADLDIYPAKSGISVSELEFDSPVTIFDDESENAAAPLPSEEIRADDITEYTNTTKSSETAKAPVTTQLSQTVKDSVTTKVTETTKAPATTKELETTTKPDTTTESETASKPTVTAPETKAPPLTPSDNIAVTPTLPEEKIVYWVDSGEVWHLKESCSSLSRSKNIRSGSISSAKASGKERVCKRCGK